MDNERDECGDLIKKITIQGYAIWIKRMQRVNYGIVLHKARHNGLGTLTAYAAGDTLVKALERALAKIEVKAETENEVA